MTKTKTPKSSKQSYPKFISFELFLTAISFLAAYFGALWLYPIAPGVFSAVANVFPSFFGSITGFAAAYFVVAALVWIGSNSLLFLTGLRRL